jgi:hypothetical protein
MKTLLASAILLATSSAYAHDSCDVELDMGLNINKNAIEFLGDNDKVRYQIINNETLIIDGEALSLNASQQSLVTDYSDSIRAVLPEVKSIAFEGIDLASDGVNMAFNELLGQNNSVGAELTQELSNIREELEQRFSEDNTFHINNEGIDSDDFFGEEFEERIESVVESAIMKSMGSILVAVGQEMLFSSGDKDTFETRMENFGAQIENEMESRANTIKQKADALCYSILNIDLLEEQLKAEVSELASYNMVTVNMKDNNDSI